MGSVSAHVAHTHTHKQVHTHTHTHLINEVGVTTPQEHTPRHTRTHTYTHTHTHTHTHTPLRYQWGRGQHPPWWALDTHPRTPDSLLYAAASRLCDMTHISYTIDMKENILWFGVRVLECMCATLCQAYNRIWSIIASRHTYKWVISHIDTCNIYIYMITYT